ncbi:hypothetical protein PBRA_006894 [Plasmodiophora brassicae]|uniref:Nucleotide-diphospho-sugar transferase domain-containing protein n=1 Tax=Plasmodiophora brassicae TaxID=37360 RepID=A0A0G4IU30_PLABS|nr:hypothetical protein PBRA_006894 [Plasmodiophora brassicae]
MLCRRWPGYDPAKQRLAIGACIVAAFQIVAIVAALVSSCWRVSPPAAVFAVDDEPDFECGQLGLSRPLNPDALATIILTPKPIAKNTYNAGGMNHFKFMLHSRRILDRVNFIVMTKHCPTAKVAHRLGLPTMHPASGSAIGDQTYNHVMETVTRIGTGPILGFTNSDIIFLDTLPPALEAIANGIVEHGWPSVFITGVRYNVDVPDEIMPMDRDIDDGTWRNWTAFVRANGKKFQDITADFFFWNRDAAIDWMALPPFLIGGTGFDNWIVAYAQANKEIVTINLTPSVDTIHMNHGEGHVYHSHFSPASTLNLGSFDKSWDPYGEGSCDVNDLDWKVAAKTFALEPQR